MKTTPQENALYILLRIYSVLFLAAGIAALYLFPWGAEEHRLSILAAPILLFTLFACSAIAAGGVRSNYIFMDSILIILFGVFICAFVKLIFTLCGHPYNCINTWYLTSSLVLFIPAYVLWRNAVKSRFGLAALPASAALSYRAMAECVIGEDKAAGYSFDTTVKDFDDYLNRIPSQGTLQVRMMYIALQYLPLLFLNLPFTWMSDETRENFIKKRFYNSTGMLRTIIRSSKQLVYFIYYANKPSFASTGYVMFENRERFAKMPKQPVRKPLPVTYIQKSTTMHTDICVIGSGASGAVTAYNLAKKTGKKVTIVEKGKYFYPPEEFTNIEPEMIGKIYKDGGLEMTQDFDLAVLQGICVGGSTVINNGICFRTPDNILQEWEQLGANIDKKILEDCFTNVEKIIQTKALNTSITNEGANRFFAGAQQLGLQPQWFDTNFGECGGSGYCNIGCKYDRKLSMLLNYLPMFLECGGEIIADAGVTKIHTSGGRAEKITCRTSNGADLTITADHFVLASGAINTSGLLLQSGIRNNVGTRLSFNVTTPVMIKFKDKIDSFDGVQMCCYVKGDGFLLETTFNPPGVSALTMQGWFETLNARMREYTHFATAAPVVGSEPNGKVKLSLLGETTLDYDMTPGDFTKMKSGLKMLCEVFLAAGAEYILPSTYDNFIIKNKQDIANIDTAIKQSSDISLSTAHPQGGTPMSDNTNLGAVGSDYRVHGYKNLYVTDASIFPTGVTVNPQLSIMGMATYGAQVIAATV